jgi:hypothetical protein
MLVEATYLKWLFTYIVGYDFLSKLIIVDYPK